MNQCKHGQLARVCEICELERENAELRESNKAVEVALGGFIYSGSYADGITSLRLQLERTRDCLLYERNRLNDANDRLDELRAKLFKAETERGVMFDEYDKLRAKLEEVENSLRTIYVGDWVVVGENGAVKIYDDETHLIKYEALNNCNTCANRGLVNGESQESYCSGCVHGTPWKRDHYMESPTHAL